MTENDFFALAVFQKFWQYFLLWLTGGILYFYMEIMFRGYSHYSMIICGGFCFLISGKVGLDIMYKKSRFYIIKIMAVAAVVITTLEFITGIIVNIIFDLKVWDYSDVWGNVMGQICIPYTFMWGVLGLLCVYATWIIENFIINPKNN